MHEVHRAIGLAQFQKCPCTRPEIEVPRIERSGGTNLPWHTYASTNVYYGSGFTNGQPGLQYPGNYLRGHTTVDLALGKTFAEKYTVSVDALNVANRRVQLDNSLTFGGFHWNDPRQLYVEFRYRFRY